MPRKYPLSHTEIGSFDFVHTRFCWSIFQIQRLQLHKLGKHWSHGGRALLFDDDHETMVLYPEPAGFQKVVVTYMDSYVEVGNDPFIGRKNAQDCCKNKVLERAQRCCFLWNCYGTETFPWF